MKAAVLYKPNTPLIVEELNLSSPKPGEVKVRMAAAGVCASDHHWMTGDAHGPMPIVPVSYTHQTLPTNREV